MNSMYENDTFKRTNEEIFADMESVYRISIYSNKTSEEIASSESGELIECIKKDVEELPYSRIENEGWGFTVDIEYVSAKKNNDDVMPDKNGKEA